MRSPSIIVIGAGIGGLAAAIVAAAQGARVTVLERADAPGGKLRPATVGGLPLDAGPTVFTMRWVFEELFAAAGADLATHLPLQPATTLARHAWGPEQRLDLFADIDRSADAIGQFAGAAEARGYRAFCDQARRIYRTLEHPFIRGGLPTPLSLMRSAGLRGLPDLLQISPFDTLWRALGGHFKDPRLRQLFGRYATYCGSSPFLAPATLMLVAHVEQDGVWLVPGGMHRVAGECAALAGRLGATLRTGAGVRAITVAQGRASGVELDSGERLEADAVICNADAAALAAGLFGPAASGAAAPQPAATRSLSAVTWALRARTNGFPLLRHSVFFTNDYAAEFEAVFKHRRLPASPTVYVCAQDRDDQGDAADQGGSPADAERLLCLINAPANGDARAYTASEIEECTKRTFAVLARCGLNVDRQPALTQVTTPADFATRYPATGGGLYGQAVHGPMASFRRPGARSHLPGLYLAGGSTHPGAGLPMAALSGRMAATTLLADFASTGPSRKTAMSGGMSTR